MKLKDLIPEIYNQYNHPAPVLGKKYNVDYELRTNSGSDYDDINGDISQEDMKKYQEFQNYDIGGTDQAKFAIGIFWQWYCHEYGQFGGYQYHKYKVHSVKPL